MENNLQLDENILNRAKLLVEGQGDGRISEADMIELLKLEYKDPIQLETLLYIVQTYKLTTTAKRKFLSSLTINC